MPNLQVSLVTGAGSGIGRAIARLLSARGCRVALVGRTLETLEQTAAMLEHESVCIQADIADPAEAIEAVDAAIERFGRLDWLINNAGWAPLCSIDESSPAFIQATFNVNAIGPACMIHRVWQTFMSQSEADDARDSCIVNISTLGTLDPFPGFFAYAASKAAVNVMAHSCANEGGEIGVRAFAIAPGCVETNALRDNFDESIIPPSKCLSPEDVAAVVIDCLIGNRDHENGETIYLPGPE